MSKLDKVLEKAQKAINLDIRSAREQCEKERIFFDSCGLNYVLGGGWMPGRIYLISGPYSQGKTSLACYIASQIQKQSEHNQVVYIDVEYALELQHCVDVGLDIDNNFTLLRPKSAEDIFNLIQDIAETDEVGLIVIDSLTSLGSKAQLESDFSGFSGGKTAAVLAEGFKKIIPYLYNNNCSLLLIAQQRANIGGYGADFKVATSNSPLYYSSWNARITRTGEIIDPETKDLIGIEIRIRNSKSKLSNPKRDAILKYYFKGGPNTEDEYLDYLVSLGVVKKQGAMYEVEGDAWGMGRVRGIEAVKTFLKEHPDTYAQVKKDINALLSGHTALDDIESRVVDPIIDPITGEILSPATAEVDYAAEDDTN